jgi:hypothetical protein
MLSCFSSVGGSFQTRASTRLHAPQPAFILVGYALSFLFLSNEILRASYDRFSFLARLLAFSMCPCNVSFLWYFGSLDTNIFLLPGLSFRTSTKTQSAMLIGRDLRAAIEIVIF